MAPPPSRESETDLNRSAEAASKKCLDPNPTTRTFSVSAAAAGSREIFLRFLSKPRSRRFLCFSFRHSLTLVFLFSVETSEGSMSSGCLRCTENVPSKKWSRLLLLGWRRRRRRRRQRRRRWQRRRQSSLAPALVGRFHPGARKSKFLGNTSKVFPTRNLAGLINFQPRQKKPVAWILSTHTSSTVANRVDGPDSKIDRRLFRRMTFVRMTIHLKIFSSS